VAEGKFDQVGRAGLIASQRGRLTKHVMFCAMAIALSGWAQGGAAQALKKYVTPDGNIVYSDKPVPGAKLVGEVQAPPPPDRAALEAARQREAAKSAEANRLTEKRLQEQVKERQTAEEAGAKLKRAQDALEQGRVPKPGERIGTAGGGTRFTDEYLARQRENEDAAKRAAEELNKAQGR
jgi:hypothetical protein